MNCRHCNNALEHTFLDLGFAPPSNAYVSKDKLVQPEKYFPLKVKVCDKCWLVQTEDYAEAEDLFSDDYAYFSSTSSGWLSHAKRYVEEMVERLSLDHKSHVIEVASNDGYLLRNFVSKGIPCLGIEPTASTAAASEKLDIPVLQEFFSENLGIQLASSGQKADLILGNNVYAHVPDINDFTKGLKAALKSDGTVTLEFPHLLNLLKYNQFDTVYHEHFSYLSLYTVSQIFEKAGLKVFDVDKLSTHGGSIRVFGCHMEHNRPISTAVEDLLSEEKDSGLQTLDLYTKFQEKAEKVKDDFLLFLLEKKKAGLKVAAYGAAAKGNTLLNYAGVKPDLLSFVCDAALAKQSKYMPGSHIPILPPEELFVNKLDYLVILPWNIANEVKEQNVTLVNQGVKFVIAVPHLQIL